MKRFGTLAICLLMMVLMANKCKKEETTTASVVEEKVSSMVIDNVLDQLCGNTWYHSREEDKDGVLTYRDGSYKFPPARGGRHGFKLAKGGKMWEYSTGPADRPMTTEGTWEMTESKDGVQVKLTKFEKEMSYILEFISLEDNVLKLKIVNQ